MEIQALLLEKEKEWKNEDIAKWKSKAEAKARLEEDRLKPKLEEKERVRQELNNAVEQIQKLKDNVCPSAGMFVSCCICRCNISSFS